MSTQNLTMEERHLLLKLARQSIEAVVNHQPLVKVKREEVPERLWEHGASFVTLTEADGALRGCIGALEAYQPLALDVQEHAAAAAVDDYRFQPVRPAELAGLHIEISRLSRPQPLAYEGPADLIARLRPGVDGVILRDGVHRATFLPQVWEQLPEAEEFLAHLCRKMGAPASLWRTKKLEVAVYQVEEWHEVK